MKGNICTANVTVRSFLISPSKLSFCWSFATLYMQVQLRRCLVNRMTIRICLGLGFNQDHLLSYKNRAVPARLAGRNLDFYGSLCHNLLPNEIECRSGQNAQDVPGQIAPTGDTTVMLIP